MITIITVTFNAAATLRRTLDSVESQVYSDIEHIIMDGGSTDGTVAMMQQYAARTSSRYKTITVSEPDKGLYDAMNKALKLAHGDFVCFLNAGDKLHDPDTLCRVARQAAGDVGVIYGDTDIVDDNGTFLRRRRLTPPDTLTWRSFTEGMLVCHQSFYVNRLIAQGYDTAYRFSADFDWCIRCMKVADSKAMRNVAVRDGRDIAVLTSYLSEGMTTANHKASLRERFTIMSHHYGLLPTILRHAWFVVRAIIK